LPGVRESPRDTASNIRHPQIISCWLLRDGGLAQNCIAKLSGDFYGCSADVAAQHVAVAMAEKEGVAGFEFFGSLAIGIRRENEKL
jgi:hypothetical protein